MISTRWPTICWIRWWFRRFHPVPDPPNIRNCGCPSVRLLLPPSGGHFAHKYLLDTAHFGWFGQDLADLAPHPLDRKSAITAPFGTFDFTPSERLFYSYIPTRRRPNYWILWRFDQPRPLAGQLKIRDYCDPSYIGCYPS